MATSTEVLSWNLAASAAPRSSNPNSNVIVIASHVSGLKFLENLLISFGSYDKYPIYLVINEYRAEVEPLFQELLAKFKHLPISVGRLESNSFEFGGLLCAYEQTTYDNFFLIPHSCEIVDPTVFEIAFEEYRGRSAAFFLRQQFQVAFCWESHIGKYRREVLTAIDFKRFQPHNIYEATHRSEFPFTYAYQRHEPTSFAFNRLSGPVGQVIEKFGKRRLKMATPYLIKWKTHWSTPMLLQSFPEKHTQEYVKCLLGYLIGRGRGALTRIKFHTREGLIGLYGGAFWSSRFFYWRQQVRKHPELKSKSIMIRRSKYNRDLVRFCASAERDLFEHDHLDSSSLVMDVGAFVGEDADKLFHRYHCKVRCFEPMPAYFAQLARRFQAEPDVQLQQIGLSDRNYQTTLEIPDTGPPGFNFPVEMQQVQMRDVAEVFASIDRDVDLLKVNIEGGEYALLQRMLEKDLLRRCKKVIVKFYDVGMGAKSGEERRREIIAAIEKTHDATFSYPFIWEGWQRRESPSK